MRGLDASTPYVRYAKASEMAADRIIVAYSTSFGAATRLLGARHRTHVRNIYALVRVADELVDGAMAETHATAEELRSALDRLETETERALETGYSSNPIVQAFACTARTAGIRRDLTRPFFSSMRTDLAADPQSGRLRFDSAAHAAYVYGSAEVIGLMCLRVFIREESYSPAEEQRLEHGARQLGAAFQNVNFLRDLADDTGRLGRSYLSASGPITPELRDGWLAVIREQLSEARATLHLLPRDARLAVAASLRLFSRLADRISRTTADGLSERRIRVPGAEKAWLIARATLDVGKRGAS